MAPYCVESITTDPESACTATKLRSGRAKMGHRAPHNHARGHKNVVKGAKLTRTEGKRQTDQQAKRRKCSTPWGINNARLGISFVVASVKHHCSSCHRGTRSSGYGRGGRGRAAENQPRL